MKENSAYTILVVDDNEAGRYVSARFLRAAGYQVLEASTGAEALELAARRPDVVVLDVNLPDMHGFEICRRLKTLPRNDVPAVLHVSAASIEITAQVQGLEGGADGYITQPVDPEVLLAHVGSLLRLRHSEKALMAERDFTDSIFDTLHAVLVVFSPDGRFVRANRTAAELSGYTPEELSQPDALTRLVPPDEQSALDSEFDSLVRGGAPSRHSNHWISKTGERRLIQWSNSSLRDPEGAVQFILSAGIDVTERQQALEQMSRSEARFRALFEQAGVGVCEIDIRTHRFLRVNRRFCAIVGYSPEELGKIDNHSIVYPEDLTARIKGLRRMLNGAIGDFSMELRYLHKNGSLVWVNSTFSLIWRPGEEPTSFVSVVEDITARKQVELENARLEEQLRHAQKMEAAATCAAR